MWPDNLYVVVGLGVTGLSCVNYLVSHKMPVVVMDTRLVPPNLAWFKQTYPDVPLFLGDLPQDLLDAAQTIVLSPGVDLRYYPVLQAELAKGKSIIGDIELFARALPDKVRIVAITGSNGKSTVTTLVGLMLQESGVASEVAGNIGRPVLELLANTAVPTQPMTWVLELSSFQLDTLQSLRPQVATILNVTPDHLDRYADFQAYVDSKQKIYQNCQIAVCNRDDPKTECKQQVGQRKFYFTLEQPVANEFGVLRKNAIKYLAFANKPLMPVLDLPIKGRYYQANALAALAIGYSLGLNMAAMLRVLRSFTGLAHRCQLVRERRGVSWYNDSKATNVAAAVAAISGLGAEISGKVVLLAGGVFKEHDLSDLVAAMQQYGRTVILFGEAQQILAAAFANVVVVKLVNDMAEAVQVADQQSHHGDCVLLSPACASFDMFSNFAQRGDIFSNLVDELAE